MTAYLIAHRRKITDSQALKQYAEGIDASLTRFGGEVVARADSFEVLEGAWQSGTENDDSEPERITVIAFPDMKSLKSWYTSDGYAKLKSIRQRSAVADIVALEVK